MVRQINVKKGSYSIKDITDVSINKIECNKLTGKSVVDSSIKNFDYYLNNILGLNNDNYVDTLLSKKSFTFSTNMLSTTDSLHNGIPSHYLYTGSVSKDISFGDIIMFEPTNIQFKTLSNGIIDRYKG